MGGWGVGGGARGGGAGVQRLGLVRGRQTKTSGADRELGVGGGVGGGVRGPESGRRPRSQTWG